LEEVLAAARARNPRVRAAGFMVQAAQAREAGAGVIPDPMLEVGVMNLSLPRLSADMAASMAPVLQATQQLPLPSKLSLARAMAHQETLGERAAGEEMWWEVRAEAAGAFYRLYGIDRERETMTRTLTLLRDFETVARSMYAAGMGRQADVLRAGLEVARMEAALRRMDAHRSGAVAELNALLANPGAHLLPSPALPRLGSELPPPDTLLGWAGTSRPLVTRARADLERAKAMRGLADREIWPDLTVGVQLGLGRMDGETRSMGGAMLGISLPVHAARRQFRVRDEAAAMERVALARLDEVMVGMDARIREVVSDVEQTRALLDQYRGDILPQARAAVESALAAYRVGGVDFMTLVDAQMAVNALEAEYFVLLGSYGTALAELESTVGRDLPVVGDVITEAR
jgi:outer membrane protein TolC